jgi:hypothetical protein
VFLAGELRTWLLEHEETLQQGTMPPADRHLRLS